MNINAIEKEKGMSLFESDGLLIKITNIIEL